MRSVLTVIGTRPEAIKLIPIILAFNNTKSFTNKVCITNQHTDLVVPILLNFKININYELKNFKNNNILYQNTAHILEEFGTILTEAKPDVVIVQGDTTTAFAAALAAFYLRIPVAHIEAGLRTGNLYSPWPEEAHRCLIDKITTYFFAPTLEAKNNLIKEGISTEKIWVVGNTSIDSIRLTRESSNLPLNLIWRKIIVTLHRRENHGEAIKGLCQALLKLVETFMDVKIIFLIHPNPAISAIVREMLSGVKNIELIEPMIYHSFINLLAECIFILTDSGGIQEEATYIGKPVLIIRDTTERPEGVQAGTARLVGTCFTDILSASRELLTNPSMLAKMSKTHFPYGDGYTAERIINILNAQLSEEL